MATVITNQATLSYNYGDVSNTVSSNVASTVLRGAVTLSKTSLSTTYTPDGELTYMISVTNESDSAINNITVVDDLGTFVVNGTETATPLTYVGPAQLFINGVFASVLTPVVTDDSVTFTIPTIPANGTAQILYLAETNEFSPLESGSEITNTATASGDTICEDATDSLTLTVEDAADVRILKTMAPNPVFCGGTLTYTFEISNYGNVPATDVVLTDTFNPAPSDITVTVNGAVIAPVNYTYVNGTLTLPTGGGLSITIPAATITTDPVTGVVTTTPGIVTVVVTGTL